MKREWIVFSLTFSMIVLFAGLNSSAEQPEKTTIFLKEEYVVPKDATGEIKIGDVAKSIQAPDLELKQKLAELEVMEAPKPGEKDRLPSNYIILAVRRAGYPYHQLYLEGASTINVYGPGKHVTVQEMIEAIYEDVKKDTDWDKDELILRVISVPPRDCWLPDKPMEMVVERSNLTPYGTSRYEIQFFVDNILKEKVPFVVSVQRQRKAWVPTRTLQRGEVVQEEDLREKILVFDSAIEDDQVVDNKEKLIGKRCRTAIRKNQPIKWHTLETNYIMKRGDLANMIIRNNGMTMVTSVKVQDRCAVGDVVHVKTAQTGHTVKAKVLNRKYVVWVAS